MRTNSYGDSPAEPQKGAEHQTAQLSWRAPALSSRRTHFPPAYATCHASPTSVPPHPGGLCAVRK